MTSSTADETFTGVYPAMCTPFHHDGSIDFDQLRTDAQRLEAAGVDGLVPMGSTGESATVSHDEHIEVIEAVVDAVDVPVVAGTGSNNTSEALSLSQRAADAGADALLLISPYYNRPQQRGLREHYETIADAVSLPQIVYNVPSRTGRNLDPETVVELARHENIQGYKAAGGDLGQIGEIIERTRGERFDVLSGNDGETLPILSTGGTGCISVAANVEPRRVCSLVEAARGGNYDRARERHHELGPLFRALFLETNPVPVKAAMAYRGNGNGNLRQPLAELAEEYRVSLESVLDSYEPLEGGH
ncbi:4-hydroxy-tetrahydrodipicolinate synthase [Halovenus salina]|uniref:4-hydroxy-tetrahydrodipicolinate synthase n=1 Tax=Halovenus salina TaxID=1510225 RepID=UPI002260F2FE|nr:4-hydroxy-tetrahydrodipicolinate synthase [Halovenus salina]